MVYALLDPLSVAVKKSRLRVALTLFFVLVQTKLNAVIAVTQDAVPGVKTNTVVGMFNFLRLIFFILLRYLCENNTSNCMHL